MKWGQLLHGAALPRVHTENVMKAWARIDDDVDRRFSVYVDATLEADAPEADEAVAREVGTLLLGLPWELLHDGEGFLFQGARPTRVRRRLPNTRVLDAPVVATPIRILLVSPRPEDEACGYIDYRSSALPLVEAMEELGGFVRIQVLSPPTLPALREELDRARRSREPYHVVHFDGHGVYDRAVGLGGLCFEEPEDVRQAGETPARHGLHRRTWSTAARAPHPARFPRRLPDRTGREGVGVRRVRAAEGRRGLRRGHEPQRAGRDRAPFC